MNDNNPLRGELYASEGNYGNYSNSYEGSGLMPRERARRLTAEQVERVQRLVSQGMSPKYARAEVLGEDLDAQRLGEEGISS